MSVTRDGDGDEDSGVGGNGGGVVVIEETDEQLVDEGVADAGSDPTGDRCNPSPTLPKLVTLTLPGSTA